LRFYSKASAVAQRPPGMATAPIAPPPPPPPPPPLPLLLLLPPPLHYPSRYHVRKRASTSVFFARFAMPALSL
jgi:hypothetical protein